MVACRYEISLLVFNSRWHLTRSLHSLASYRVKHSRRNSIPTRVHGIFSKSALNWRISRYNTDSYVKPSLFHVESIPKRDAIVGKLFRWLTCGGKSVLTNQWESLTLWSVAVCNLTLKKCKPELFSIFFNLGLQFAEQFLIRLKRQWQQITLNIIAGNLRVVSFW